MRHEIGLLPIAFFSVVLAFVITGGLWWPRVDALLVALEGMK